jgi:HK97 family phage major capsid protein
MTLNEQKEQLRTQIAALTAKPNLSASERTKLNALIAQGADIRATEQRQERAASALASARKDLPVADTDEQRAANHEAAFTRYLKGNVEAIRTYSPMSTSSGVAIPQGFLSAYVEHLKSFSGIRKVANVITTATGQSLKNPYADDGANIGERLNESDPVSLANPVFSSATFGAFRYSSKGVKYSAQLLADAGIPVENYLSKTFARRIGILQNQEFTLGGSGGPTGVIPSLTQIVNAANANSIGVADVVSLTNIDEAYLEGAQFMFSPAVERYLKTVTGTDGLPVFPEMRTGKILCGFPYTLNTAMVTSITTGQKTMLFGNYAHGITVREITPQLLVSRERYAEQNMLYAALRADADCLVTDQYAINVLQQA